MSYVCHHVNENGKRLVILINGRFDFTLHSEFRRAYRDHPNEGDLQYQVDLSKVNYMDSSALGMLLLLREYAGGDSARVIIANPSPRVRKVLEIANFQKMFILE